MCIRREPSHGFIRHDAATDAPVTIQGSHQQTHHAVVIGALRRALHLLLLLLLLLGVAPPPGGAPPAASLRQLCLPRDVSPRVSRRAEFDPLARGILGL